MLLSIVIPIYNNERYLSYCLDSLLSYQTVEKELYELVLVNDGSKDNSMSIMQSYASKYPNITLIHQENAGVSAARNKGIETAKGKYVWFVDGDDFVKADCLKTIFDSLKEKVDVYHFCGYSFQQEDFNEKLLYQDFKGTSQSDIWTYIFSMDFLRKNHIRFEEGIHYSETQLFINDVHLKKPYQFSDSNTWYYYRINSFSANRKNIQRKITCYFDLFELLTYRLEGTEYPTENTLSLIFSILEMRFMYAMNDMSIVSFEQFARGKAISKRVNMFIIEHDVPKHYKDAVVELGELCSHCENETWSHYLNLWRKKKRRSSAIKSLKKRINHIIRR